MNVKQILRITKMYKKQIEDLQLEKTSLFNELTSLQGALETIKGRREEEMEFISQNPIMNLRYESFFASLKGRGIQINNSINSVKHSISLLDEKIIEAYKEQRKYEILIDKLKAKELEQKKKDELKLFDEISNLKRIAED